MEARIRQLAVDDRELRDRRGHRRRRRRARLGRGAPLRGRRRHRHLLLRVGRGARRRARHHQPRVAARQGARRARSPATRSTSTSPTGATLTVEVVTHPVTASSRRRDRGRRPPPGCRRADRSSCRAEGRRSSATAPAAAGEPTVLLLHGLGVTADANWFPAYPAPRRAATAWWPSTTAATVAASAPTGRAAGRLRRRRGRRARCARHRPGDRRRLLDGRPDRAAPLAPPPRADRPGWSCARPPTASVGSNRSRTWARPLVAARSAATAEAPRRRGRARPRPAALARQSELALTDRRRAMQAGLLAGPLRQLRVDRRGRRPPRRRRHHARRRVVPARQRRLVAALPIPRSTRPTSTTPAA